MANTPKIRFEGFTDDWEQRKLGDMLDRYEDPVETPHDGYERIGIRSHAKGVFHSYVEAGKELDTAKMHRVAADKFILNITFAWEHAVAITKEEDAGTLVSHRFPQFSFHQDLKSHFFKYLMLDSRFKDYLELCSPGGAGRNRVLNINDMLKYVISVPSVEEQTKIGVYFDTLDTLITLHQRKCDETKELKNYMLQKMFPKAGEKVPEIRFAGFTDDWEQRKLGELVKIGDIDHRMPRSVDEGIPYLMTGDFCGINELNFEGVKHISLEDYISLSKKIKPEKGDIIFARYASVGAVRYIDFTRDFLVSYSCAILKNGSKINSKYLYHFLTTDLAQNQIQLEINTGSQANIGIDSMKNSIVISMPSKEEQIKISEYFTDLDNLITLHQRKCDNLKILKQYMLQNMFPQKG